MEPQCVGVGAWAGARSTDDHALAREHSTSGAYGVESQRDGIFEATGSFDDRRLHAPQGDQQSCRGRVGSDGKNRGARPTCGQ